MKTIISGLFDELNIDKNTVGYSLTKHLHLLKHGKFPHENDQVTKFFETPCIQPFDKIVKAEQAYMLYSDDNRKYAVEMTDDGHCRVVPNFNNDESVLLLNKDEDGRDCITATSKWPHCVHGFMFMQFANGEKRIGSGILVGPHHVLTAAHNIYSHKSGECWVQSVTFSPGQHHSHRPFGFASGSVLLTFRNYIDTKSETDDIAMVILDSPIGYKTGWFGLLSAPTIFLTNNFVSISGYPANINRDTHKNTPELWTMSNKLKTIPKNKSKVFYDIATSVGQSGSGICCEMGSGKEKYYVLGIHTRGGSRYSGNSGTLISLEKFDCIIKWLEMFQIENMIHPKLPTKDELESKELFNIHKKGAEKGDIDSQNRLGVDYYVGSGTICDYNKAVMWFTKAAARGYAAARDNLSNCYYYGHGVSQSYDKAAALYQLAANQNYTRAQYRLGNCYYYGYGVTQSYEKAAALFKLAADQGDAEAQIFLGQCYNTGYGVTQNYQKAAGLYQLAADQGSAIGQYNLGHSFYYGYGVTQSYEKAAALFKLAADQGHAQGQYNLGHCYYNGHGVTQNYHKATELYQLAADQGSAIGQCNLGHSFYYGYGVTQSYEKAAALFKLAADQGDAGAQNFLGICYERGHGVSQDYDKAAVLYKRAADQGISAAQKNLVKIQKKCIIS